MFCKYKIHFSIKQEKNAQFEKNVVNLILS